MSRERLLFGKLLIIAGILLVVVWASYFLRLVRPIDAWDVLPLAPPLALITLGVKLTRIGELLLIQAAFSHKRNLLLALAFGVVLEMGLWAFLHLAIGDSPEMAERYLPLERLQEPGLRVGLALYRYTEARLGTTAALYLGVASAFLTLMTIWSIGAFVLLSIIRLRRAQPFSLRHQHL